MFWSETNEPIPICHDNSLRQNCPHNELLMSLIRGRSNQWCGLYSNLGLEIIDAATEAKPASYCANEA